jgi:hypothetical protein
MWNKVPRHGAHDYEIQCVSASIFTRSYVQTVIDLDPYSLVATSNVSDPVPYTGIHLAVGTFCTSLLQSLRRILHWSFWMIIADESSKVKSVDEQIPLTLLINIE